MASNLPLYPAAIDALLAQTPGKGRVKSSYGKKNPSKPAAKPGKTKALAPTVTLTQQNSAAAPYIQLQNELQAGMGRSPVNRADMPVGMSGPTLRQWTGQAQADAKKAVPPELELEMARIKARLTELKGVREQLELTPPEAEEPYSLPAPVQRPEMTYPERPQAQMNPMAGALAAIAGLADPQMAGQYAATVNQSAQQAADTAYQDRIARFQNDLEQKTRAYEDESARRLERIRNDMMNRELARDDKKVKTEYERLKGHLSAQADAIRTELEGTQDFSAKMQAAVGKQAESDRLQSLLGGEDAKYYSEVEARNKALDRLFSTLGPQIGQDIRQQSEQTFKGGESEKDRQLKRELQQKQLQAAMDRQQATIAGANYRAGLAAQKKVAKGEKITPAELNNLLIAERMADDDLAKTKMEKLKLRRSVGNEWTATDETDWKTLIDAAQKRVEDAKAAIKKARGDVSQPGAPVSTYTLDGVNVILRKK